MLVDTQKLFAPGDSVKIQSFLQCVPLLMMMKTGKIVFFSWNSIFTERLQMKLTFYTGIKYCRSGCHKYLHIFLCLSLVTFTKQGLVSAAYKSFLTHVSL